MGIRQRYSRASVKTADQLKTIAHTMALRKLSKLSLPEIDEVVDLVARIVPAGNVPGVILSGLSRLPGRKPPLKTLRRDINLLFKGTEQLLDKAVYGAFFAGPAAVIWGYQNLLKLAGKDLDDAFPEGTWQFYVDYALREDSARHANETHGFDSMLQQHGIQLGAVDRIAAWAMAAATTLHDYDALLENEWRERVYSHLLGAMTKDAGLYRRWERQRPYGRGADAGPNESYTAYRRRRFDQFIDQKLSELPEEAVQEWRERIREAEAEDLPAYQRQMSIRAYLDAEAYGEVRTPLALEQLQVGVIHDGRYYLLPACAPGGKGAADVLALRAGVASVLARPAETPQKPLSELVQVRRAALPGLRDKFGGPLRADLDALRRAPILINADKQARALPLAQLRQAERGSGDHALTIFDTGTSFVFDQSHIFFDGAWGAALAEIMTNEALAWALYLSQLAGAQPGVERPHAPAFAFGQRERALLAAAPKITAEASAETETANVQAILGLRKLFKQRSDLLQLTVNDLLVLYRALHAMTYRPAPALVDELQRLATESAASDVAAAALEALESSGQDNPAILIPVDASQGAPRDRLYPMSFEVPLAELDLLRLHTECIAALKAYEGATGERGGLYEQFDELQRTYLAALAGFGAVLSRAKEIAVRGESASVGSIKLLAHMPLPLQRLLDDIPGRFDILNDIIKGREVLSNVGAVAPSSTLTRFITAKDDNEKKTLAWGIITAAEGTMRISLRDFRPHVALLRDAGQAATATRMTEDYLESYAQNLNQFIRDLRLITLASRDTQATT